MPTVREPFLGQTCVAPVDVGGRVWTGFRHRLGHAHAFGVIGLGVKIGRCATKSVYFPALRDLLVRAFGPVPLIERALRSTDGVEKAFLYGSWAARYLGEAGDAPNDLDLLVVGAPQRSARARITRDLEDQLGYEINPTVVPAEEWEAKKSGFLQSVARGPLVELDLIG